MKVNMGVVDRGIRAVVGVVIIILGVAYKSWWGAVGLLPLLTAAIARCPAYLPFGISTCRIATPPAAPPPRA